MAIAIIIDTIHRPPITTFGESRLTLGKVARVNSFSVF